MSKSFCLTELTESVLTVTINRPEARNALSRDTLIMLGNIFNGYKDNTNIKVVILKGMGEKSFAAGGDLKEFNNFRSKAEAEDISDIAFNALRAIKQFPVPVIAALNGSALGGGAELALACDFRVAAQHTKIGFVQASLGITSSWGGAIYLIERIGSSNALRLLTTAQVLNANDAKIASVIDEICSDNETLDECISRFIKPMIKIPSQSLRGSKALSIAYHEQLYKNLRATERSHFTHCWLHEDHWTRVEKILTHL